MMTGAWIRSIYIACCMVLLPISGIAVTPHISAGQWSGFAVLDANGTVWTTGNAYVNNSSQPAQLPGIADAKSVSMGSSTIWIIRADDSLWGAGSNNYGELGTGGPGTAVINQPVKVLDRIRQVVERGSATYAVGTDGSLWVWGRNGSYQLGLGDKVDRAVPTRVPGLTDVVKVAAGAGTHAVVLTGDGTVWTMGSNCCGQLGRENTVGTPFNKTPQLFPNMDGVVAIAAADAHTFMIRRDGTLWASGGNFNGELGLGEVANNVGPVGQVLALTGVVDVVSQPGFALALLRDGSVWGWGANRNGQLGGLGRVGEPAPIRLDFLAGVTAIAVGGGGSGGAGFALRADGAIVSWADNSDLSLGRGAIDATLAPGVMAGPGGVGTFNVNAAVPATVNSPPWINLRVTTSGDRAPVVVTVNVNAGDNDGSLASIRLLATDGQSASINGAAGTASFNFTTVGTYRVDAIAVDNRGGATVARGSPDITVRPPAIAINTSAKISAGFKGPIVVNSRGQVRTWGLTGLVGDNVWQLFAPHPPPDGLTHAFDPRLSTVVDVFGAPSGNLAVLQSGQVLAWGDNTFGALGIATAAWVQMPAVVPGLLGIVQAVGGWSHAMALDAQGRVYATGANDYGQLGLGDLSARVSFTLLPAPTGIVQIAAAEWTTYALDSGGTVWAWGRNIYGELGNGATVDMPLPQAVPGLPPIARIFSAADGAFAIARDGTVWAWGAAPLTDTNGVSFPFVNPLPQPSLGGATKISAYYYGAMLKADGTVWTWGNSSANYLLGDGTRQSRSTPGMVPGLTDVVDVSMGNGFALALRSDGTVVSWGNNYQGNLGDGTLILRRTPVLVINEAIDGPLDLSPDIPDSIPQSLIPPFLLATYKTGTLNSTSVYADVRGLTGGGTFTSNNSGKFAAGYNVYIAANLPALQSAYFQLDSNNNWRALSWPMSAFISGVALDNHDTLIRAQILENTDLSSPLFTGTSILIGYGTDPDEMVRTGRYRTIYTVPSQ